MFFSTIPTGVSWAWHVWCRFPLELKTSLLTHWSCAVTWAFSMRPSQTQQLWRWAAIFTRIPWWFLFDCLILVVLVLFALFCCCCCCIFVCLLIFLVVLHLMVKEQKRSLILDTWVWNPTVLTACSRNVLHVILKSLALQGLARCWFRCGVAAKRLWPVLGEHVWYSPSCSSSQSWQALFGPLAEAVLQCGCWQAVPVGWLEDTVKIDPLDGLSCRVTLILVSIVRVGGCF